MGYDLKYGKVTTERGSIPEDEPVFLIRAQDPRALAAMRQYRTLCQANADGDEHVDSVKRAIDALRQWQEDNPNRVKDRPGPEGSLPK